MIRLTPADKIKITHALDGGKYNADSVLNGPDIVRRLRSGDIEFTETEQFHIHILLDIDLDNMGSHRSNYEDPPH